MYIVETLFPEIQPRYLTRIYFGLGDNGQIKIGLTKRPSGHRGGEMHFDELCSVPGGHLTERMYHDRYAVERVSRTEWFRPSDRLLLDLLEMCTKQEQYKSVVLLRRLIEQRMHGEEAA